MTIAKQKYNCWFLINPDQQNREFESLEKEASKIFLDFILAKDYGQKILAYRFDIYIKPTINYGQQTDTIYTSCAHLTVHIDKNIFETSSEQNRIKLLLSASYILIEYLTKKVPLPTGFNANELLKDYKSYLTKHSLFFEGFQNKVYKYFDTTRFNFRRTETIEIDKSLIQIDLNKIEDFINNHLAGKTFGKSINIIDFGHELFDFNGVFAEHKKPSESYLRYGPKNKNFLVVKYFDYNLVKQLKGIEQFRFLKSKILEGINDFDNLKRKPKDFDKNKLYLTLEVALNQYETKYWL